MTWVVFTARRRSVQTVSSNRNSKGLAVVRKRLPCSSRRDWLTSTSFGAAKHGRLLFVKCLQCHANLAKSHRNVKHAAITSDSNR